MRKCPQCGRALAEDRSRFCDACGCDLSATAQPETGSEASSDTGMPVPTGQSDNPALSAPVREDPGRREDGESPPRLRLYVNTNQFYMQGFSGIVHLKVENPTNEDYPLVNLRMTGDVPVEGRSFELVLGPRESKERRFQLRTLTSQGAKALSLEIRLLTTGRVREYRTDVTIPVLERVSTAKDFLLHIGNIELGQSSQKFNVGGVINIDIKNKVDRGQIRTANELMAEIGKLPPSFQPLDIELVSEGVVARRRRRWPWVLSAAVLVLACLAALVVRQPSATSRPSRDAQSVATSAQQEATAAGDPAARPVPSPEAQPDRNAVVSPVEPQPAEPSTGWSLDEAVERLAGQIRKTMEGEEGPCYWNPMTGPGGTRTRFDVVLENRLFVVFEKDERMTLAGAESDTPIQKDTRITLSRAQKDEVVVLSGAVSVAGGRRQLDAVPLLLDDSLKRLLLQKVATRPEMGQPPGTAAAVLELSPLQMIYSITGMHNAGGVWESVRVTNGATLHSGDCFKINFETNENCYVYVLLYGSGGIAQRLFPHEQIHLDNAIRGGTPYALPDGENWYYLDDVRGTETVYLVASYEPMRDIADLLTRMTQADQDSKSVLSQQIQQDVGRVRTRGLDSDEYVVSLWRGVSTVAPSPQWVLEHEGKRVQAVTQTVRGAAALVEVVSFEHR